MPPPYSHACFAFDPERSGQCASAPVTSIMISDWLYPPVFDNYVSLFAGPDPAQGIFGMRQGVIVSVVALFTLSYLVSLSWSTSG